MTSDTPRQLIACAVLATALALLPIVAPNPYYLDLATKACLAAVVCIGLNLLSGYAGQLSLGHAAFFGVGAYASAILCAKVGITPVVAMLAGCLISAGIAYVMARTVLRLKGHYLAMATLAFGVIISIVLNREVALTGGPDGMSVPRFNLFGYRTTGVWAGYGLAAVALVLAVRTAIVFVNSRVGRALRAIGDSEVAAEGLGIDIARYKTGVFVISAVFASVAGSIFAHADRFVSPAEAGFMRSVEFVAMIVIGGLGSVAGSIVGATLLTLLPQLLAGFDHYRHFLTGLILILIMIFMPAGIVPTLLASGRALHDRYRPFGRSARSVTGRTSEG
ncbi:branched-chain amino acid ABC transporter permease [Xanthobacter tagetidis]|jgi:branched-chain amino acid transport system permease protein|uniref:Branched-chain amino acid ABC transporter permease n=1 Tax=Xanthobacter tagetidis TaxID=60216 RepID=A0A3L7AKR5_9HYPH|nr:branched-chain amino acid ABC transporter permease [Xanthobacter tagetidis]RLP80624.1 branched-chain amino acid ABC transporter permease [Xanthobacter tagetidis]